MGTGGQKNEEGSEMSDAIRISTASTGRSEVPKSSMLPWSIFKLSLYQQPRSVCP